MNDPFPEELLSAYLDGELPREEQARVEQWLGASADHRRLFDDLQAIRRELQALPQQSLDTGFSDRVLAVIRERSGDTSASPPAASGASPIDAPEPTPSVPIKPANLPPRHLGMPAWRWFAAGVAATLVAVIVGMNAAPETMARVGKLALFLPQEETGEGGATTWATQPAPHTASSAPSKTAESVQRDSAGAAGPQRESRSLPKAASKDLQEIPADGGELRKQVSPDEQVPSLAEATAPSTPTLDADADDAAPAPDAALESLDKYKSDDRTGKALVPEIADKKPAPADDVVELPVTGEQADRALAFYTDALDRQEHQAARRYINVERVENLASTNEYAADEFVGQAERETVDQRSTPGNSLMKLLDAAPQGLQVGALEVTGNEAEVHALLDLLGVDAARDLRPDQAIEGAGGEVGVQTAPEGAATSAAGLNTKPAASALDKAKADGTVEKAETVAGASDRRNGAGRGTMGGGFPTVKLKMPAGFGGSEPLRDQIKRARASQQEGLDATQAQLRVRLVIVPYKADPIGPTTEVKPAD